MRLACLALCVVCRAESRIGDTATDTNNGDRQVLVFGVDRDQQLNERDVILIFSVGGGDIERNISANIVKAIDLAKTRRAKIFGVVGRATGYTARAAMSSWSCRR
jgi:D-sedoheptulose 7-phosphate isomerase